jgi:hypothetical protein
VFGWFGGVRVEGVSMLWLGLVRVEWKDRLGVFGEI